MSSVSKQTKRQILLLGIPLILKIKFDNKVTLEDLKNRLHELKNPPSGQQSIVPVNYTVDDLIKDTCICTTAMEHYYTKKEIRNMKGSQGPFKKRN